MPVMESAATPVFDSAAAIASSDARHQSSGSCSAQPVRGERNGACSLVSDPRSVPSSFRISAREPPVPTSMPRTGMAYLPSTEDMEGTGSHRETK
jgi:hypothetical protein